MSQSWSEIEPVAISRYRAVVVATLRVKQLRRGATPRIDLDHRKHKDTVIAMEEVRRGLITFTQTSLPGVQTNGTNDSKVSFEKPALVVG